MKTVLSYVISGFFWLLANQSVSQLNIDIPIAQANPAIVCNGQNSNLAATSIIGLTQFHWYASLVAETPLGSGATFETPPLTLTSFFYVSSVDNANVESVRTPVLITVLPALDIPLGLAEDPVICSGKSTQLTAQSPNELYVYRWYASLTDTSILGTGIAYQTEALFSTTIFYLASVNNQSCESARTPILVTVLPELILPIALPDDPVLCQNQTTTLRVQNVTNGYTYYWFKQINDVVPLDSGITFLTPPLKTSTSYFVAAKNSNGCQSIKSPASVVVTPAVDVPIATADPASVCSGHKTTLTATSVLNNTFRWYNNFLDTASFYQGTSFQSPPLHETSTYYVSSVSEQGCESMKTPVVILVTPSLDVVTPTPNEAVICSGKSTYVTASSVLGYSSFFWFSEQQDTLWLDTGAVFNTPLLYNTTTYWVASADESECMSLRIPVTITILPNADLPQVVNFPTVVCEQDTVRLTAFSQDQLNTFVWYNSLTDTVVQSTENPYFLPLGNESSSVFVASKNSLGCESSRIEIMLYPTPQITLDAPILSCNYGVIVWSPVDHASNYEFKWKDNDWQKINTTELRGYANKLILIRATSKQACVLPIGPYSSITCESGSKIPNTITPNGDGINDYWILPERIANQANEIKVVNENGKLVFQAKNYNNSNTLFGGSEVFSGTYFYQITLTQSGEHKTGYLTVLK